MRPTRTTALLGGLLALVVVLGLGAGPAQAAKRPELTSAMIDCEFGERGVPPCRLSILGNRVYDLDVRFDDGRKGHKFHRRYPALPQAPGPSKVTDFHGLYIWWRTVPPINFGGGHDPDLCMKISFFAESKQGLGRRGVTSICSQGVYYKIHSPR